MALQDEQRLDREARKTLASSQPLPNQPSIRQTIEGQRRQATVLFADMASYTPIAERLGEEKTYLLMRRVLQEMTEAVHAHEGTVQDLLGDGLLAVFGAPVALENAPLEACRAAVDIHARMLGLEDSFEREFGVRPKFRIGVHAGPLVVSAELRAVGDTVNLAARLQTEAEPGSVLISGATHELVSGFFETEFIGERLIKGKSKPQRVFALGRAKGETSRFDVAVHRGLTPLVARARELASLEGLWSEARKGRRRFAHIVGEAGIGKSRLISKHPLQDNAHPAVDRSLSNHS
jgi:class 3 adenylate cyclase